MFARAGKRTGSPPPGTQASRLSRTGTASSCDSTARPVCDSSAQVCLYSARLDASSCNFSAPNQRTDEVTQDLTPVTLPIAQGLHGIDRSGSLSRDRAREKRDAEQEE